MKNHGFIRIATYAPEVSVGNPTFNVKTMLDMVKTNRSSQIGLFPELGITGYTCADLFGQETLLAAALNSFQDFIQKSVPITLFVVGLPLRVNGNLYNCAAVVQNNACIGIVPKQYLPNYREFYERRWFTPGTGDLPKTVKIGAEEIPFGTDLMFRNTMNHDMVVGIEICEDLWTALPPSSFQSLAGATVLLNPSASNELVGKSDYRRDLVVGQSARCISAYAYASCGPTESTTDLVFGGHCLIAENGDLKAETYRFNIRSCVTAEVDLQRIVSERAKTSSWSDCAKQNAKSFRTIDFKQSVSFPRKLSLVVPAHPFNPPSELKKRCEEVFSIQSSGLSKRLSSVGTTGSLVIGVSGGLDSTLALLVAANACDMIGKPRSSIIGITMPGFGTTDRTNSNAVKLMEYLGVTQKAINICEMAMQTFKDMGHKPFGIDPHIGYADFVAQLKLLSSENRKDLTFENVQARLRTFILMSHGFVIGTGDMSELALGWATYNGDHMSMYNPNCAVPKTLVRSIVQYVAENTDLSRPQTGFSKEILEKVLMDIFYTPISPELLPTDGDGKATQPTEDIVGPYELHDFFLYNMVRCGFGPEKILFLAQNAEFDKEYSKEDLAKWLKVFVKRFFQNQFKRSCVPDGPKVGSVGLSPRGDWRMPSDADATEWLAEIERIDGRNKMEDSN